VTIDPLAKLASVRPERCGCRADKRKGSAPPLSSMYEQRKRKVTIRTAEILRPARRH